MKSWIRLIPFEEAEGRLKTIYQRLVTQGGTIDNILKSHSLRPHTLEGHMALYKSVLHHSRNRLPRALLEALGVYASILNACAYCADHHAAGLAKLVGQQAAANQRAALEDDAPESAFEGRGLAAMRYARTLTLAPSELERRHFEALLAAGFDEGEVLEINQVVSYFAYANRTVLGLGITTEGDELGLSPSAVDDPDDWRHH